MQVNGIALVALESRVAGESLHYSRCFDKYKVGRGSRSPTMEQESVRSGLGCKAILPVLLGGRPSRKQDMPCMYSADRQTRAKGRPMTTRMVEGTIHPYIYIYIYICTHVHTVYMAMYAVFMDMYTVNGHTKHATVYMARYIV